MAEENIEGSDVKSLEIQKLARLLFVSNAEPLGKDGSDEARMQRQEAWKSEKPKYMAQARRMMHLVESNNFGIILKFESPGD